MEILNKLYYDPKTGFQSKDKLYRKAKELDATITLKTVQTFLNNQATAQITKQVVKNKTYDTIISPAVKNNYQMDIMYLPNPKLNGTFKYLLTCIDVYSRFVFVVPLKTKSGNVVYEAFKGMLSKYGNPVNLNLDLGSEFIYTPFKKLCDDNKITLWYSDTEQENKNSIIERFHRTLRNLILKYEIANGKSYIKELPNLIENYNTTYHKTTEQTPEDIWTGKQKNLQSITKVEVPFVEGDLVRHIIKKKTFDKHSSTTNFTKKIYTITKIIGKSILLDDLTKPFKSFELVKAVGEDMNKKYDAKIDKIRKEDTTKRRLVREGLD